MVEPKPAEPDRERAPLTQEERDSLARAWRDYRAGRLMPHEDVVDGMRRRYRTPDKDDT